MGELQEVDETTTWATQTFGLDTRLVKACKKNGWVAPLLVQRHAVPCIMSGKDVLCRARTGAGKTAAYLLPVLHKTLQRKSQVAYDVQGTRCLILVPTNELCQQVANQLSELAYYCSDVITALSLAPGASTGFGQGKAASRSKSKVEAAQAVLLKSQSPDIVIATPARAHLHMTSGALVLTPEVFDTLVVDEADLVLSFGHFDDMRGVAAKLPQGVQGILMSATLSSHLDELKRLVLHSPIVLKLEDGAAQTSGKLLQFFVALPSTDKYLLIFVFLRLGLLQGKGLLFVNSIDEAYRLRLFLGRFGIRAAALNSDLPLTSRTHMLDEFNRGIFDLLIATDEGLSAALPADDDESGDEWEDEEDGEVEDGEGGDEDEDEMDEEGEEDEEDEEEDGDEDEDEVDLDAALDGEDSDEDQELDGGEDDLAGADEFDDGEDELDGDEEGEGAGGGKAKGKKGGKGAGGKKRETDDEYGVARGVDFRGVTFVVNVEMPTTPAAYTHRVGRTARAGAQGTALTLVGRESGSDLEMLAQIQADQPALPTMHGDTALAAMGPEAQEANHSATAAISQTAQPAPLAFDLGELETFRYRVEDVNRAVTKMQVREERAAELKRELLNSDKLRAYFATNPGELKTLRHDKPAGAVAQNQPHLAHIPDYLVPHSLKAMGGEGGSAKRKRRRGGIRRADKRRNKGNDPLQTFGGAGGGAEDDGEERVADPDRIYTKSDDVGQSTSGRKRWKEKHRKGEFSNKARDAKKKGYKVDGAAGSGWQNSVKGGGGKRNRR